MLDILALSMIIGIREGWNRPGSLVQRLNNPCALRYAGQRFAEPGSRGFARFATDIDGWIGCRLDIAKKVREGRERALRRAWRYLRREQVEGITGV